MRRYQNDRYRTGFAARHPHIAAREGYVNGGIPMVQAVGMVASDPEFIAECELTYGTALATRIELARAVVEGWMADAVAEAQRVKRLRRWISADSIKQAFGE